jgi:sugar/nucleoside kinase (ribokinase family)
VTVGGLTISQFDSLVCKQRSGVMEGSRLGCVWTVGLTMVDDMVVRGFVTPDLLGGGAVYAAAGVWLGGSPAGLITRFGSNLSPRMRDALRASHLRVFGAATSANVLHERVLLPDGADGVEPTYEYLADSGPLDESCPVPRDVLALDVRGCGLHIAPMPVEFQLPWIEFGREHDMRITLDPSEDSVLSSPESYWEILPECSAFLPSRHEVERFAGSDPVKAALDFVEAGAPIAVVKLGAEGCVVATPEGVVHVPAFRAEVQDITGAGDAFCGGFLAGLIQGERPVDAAIRGAKVGAMMVSVVGALDSLDGRLTPLSPSTQLS